MQAKLLICVASLGILAGNASAGGVLGPTATVDATASGNPPMTGAVSCPGSWKNCTGVQSVRISLYYITTDAQGKEVKTPISSSTTNTTSTDGSLTLNQQSLQSGKTVRAYIDVRDGLDGTGNLIAGNNSVDFKIP